MWHQVTGFLLVLLQSTATLLIVLDPFGLLPILVGLTRQMSDAQRRATISQAVLVGLALLLLFTFTGTTILGLFGATTDDLRIAGGILLLAVALSIVLSGRATAFEDADAGVGVVPIASPLLVGPGAITATVILVGASGLLVTSVAVLLSFLVTWLVLRSTRIVYRVLGRAGSDVIARIMGILLAAIAVVYIRDGVMGLLHIRVLHR